MKDTTHNRCEQFIKNRDIIKSEFGWESSYMYPLCAAIYLSKGKVANGNHLRECMDLLKHKVGVFSNFRSTAKLPIATMLSVSDNPEVLLENGLKVYELLKNEFFGTTYLPVAAMIIAELAEVHEYEQLAKRTRVIYDRMKSEHPFLTSSEDSALAALLALSPLNNDAILREMQQSYELLKPHFFSGNSVQSLSHVLTLIEGSTEEKCKRTINLFYQLKDKGYKYGTGYELPTLGVLALSCDDTNGIVKEIIEINEFLTEQKGFGAFGIGGKQRLMYAGILATDDMSNNSPMQTAAISGTISLIVAQQAAMCAAITASTAAASSASS
jgi:hypothetical protein